MFVLDISLNVSDRVQYTKDEMTNTATIVYAKNGKYQLSHLHTGEVYLDGIEIQDLHSIQKDMIYTVTVSALQRLDEIVSQQQTQLEQQQKIIDELSRRVRLQEIL
jgi:hypothetical protein